MPLNAISGNIPRSRSHVGSSSKGISDTGSSKTPVPTAPPPIAVQSMLRSTTELGDVGQLPLTRSYRSHSVSRMRSDRLRSGSFDSSMASRPCNQKSSHLGYDGRQYESRHILSVSDRSRNGTFRSSSGSHQYNSRSRNTRARLRPHGYYGSTDTANPPRPLYSHRSLVTLRSHGENRSRNSNSSSPFAPRNNGPGAYRAPSPGYGPGPYNTSARLPFPGTGGRGSATSSPASMYSRIRGHPRSYTEGDHSSMPVARWPSPAFRGPASYSGMMPHVLRHGTCGIAAGHGTQGNSVSSFATASEMPQSPTNSTAPRYYDYSESFIEEESPRPNDSHRIISHHALEHPITENQALKSTRHAQTPFGTRPGSSFRPIELPTKHNRRPSEQSINSLPPSTIPERRSSLGFISQALKRELADADAKESENETSPCKRSTDYEFANRRISSTSRRTRESSNSSIFFPNASRSPRDLPALVARIHSPKEEDRHPANISAESLTGLDERIQSLDDLLDARPQTSPKSRADNTDHMIVSPRPERPLSSQSRKKFNKILEINEQDAQKVEQTSESTVSKRKATRLSCLHEKPSPKPSYESMTPQGKDQRRSFDKIRSPHQDSALSTITSYGKSTVESLLDHHIESLGLVPESYNPSQIQVQPDNIASATDDESVITTKLSDQLLGIDSSAKVRPVTLRTCRPSSLDSDAHKKLIPHRLFSSIDTRFKSLIDINHINRSLQLPATETHASGCSSGWQTLTSDSQILATNSTKPTIMSREYADVDTTIHSRRFKIRRQPRMSQSPSSPGHLSSIKIDFDKGGIEHRRSRSDIIARQESRRRRGIRIHLRLDKRSNSVGHTASHPKQIDLIIRSKDAREIERSPAAGVLPHNKGRFAELSGDPVTCVQPILSYAQGPPVSPVVPDRWSSILAAMPLPNTKTTGILVPRQNSFRTYRSHRSNTSLAEPVNSTRIATLPTSVGNCLPKLDTSDFGPPLFPDSLKSNVPCPGMAISNIPSLEVKKSFFKDSSDFAIPKATKMKFGLSSLRSILPGSSVGTVRGSIRGSDVLQPSQSCRMQGRHSVDDLIIPESTIPMSDFAYRKRKIVQKLSNWWHRQCIQRRLALRKSRAARNLPGGMLVTN